MCILCSPGLLQKHLSNVHNFTDKIPTMWNSINLTTVIILICTSSCSYQKKIQNMYFLIFEKNKPE